MKHKALVFLSCGQRDDERVIAQQIETLIRDELKFNCYNADTRQGFDDVMSITEQLSKADYYLFIDFKRDGVLPVSVFTHQEFALARAWGITEMMAFQEEGLSSYGMLAYVLAHPTAFERQNLVDLVRKNIKSRGWSPEYSRNLSVSQLRTSELIPYTDHHGSNLERIWKAVVQNRRSDRAATNVIAILDRITDATNNKTWRPDTTFLKWSGQQAYQRTIFPQDSAEVDLFLLKAEREGIYLHSARDEYPRTSVVPGAGTFIFKYLLYADTFPAVFFEVKVIYNGVIRFSTDVLDPGTEASLI